MKRMKVYNHEDCRAANCMHWPWIFVRSSNHDARMVWWGFQGLTRQRPVRLSQRAVEIQLKDHWNKLADSGSMM